MSLGFAAGVMIAASYWSLLAPAIEMASESKLYGENGEFAFAPVGIGFLIGAAFVYGTDALITYLGIQSPNVLLAMQSVGTIKKKSIDRKRAKNDEFNKKSSQSSVCASTTTTTPTVTTTTTTTTYSSRKKLKSDKEDSAEILVSNYAKSSQFMDESSTVDGIHPLIIAVDPFFRFRKS